MPGSAMVDRVLRAAMATGDYPIAFYVASSRDLVPVTEEEITFTLDGDGRRRTIGDSAGFLNSQRMTDLIASFREEFDMVILDCPPILPVTDAAILASKTDGTLIVYRVGKIARSALKRSKTLLENVRGRVLGVVLTGLKAEISPDYEELQYYRYAYGQEPGQADRMRPLPRRQSVLDKIKGLFS